ncbi:peroxisome biogenesis protein 1 [Impatiens glandulifera]|uniref:peroxisome biogenesis protein 1 n=1 Tax=Impatiens glandulifera TaxID=253017 RepID=UPI001FB10FAD|nr:peroxisome biogenesis protein 1 [Impatiens glandulifera]XP_047316284.1 peroxisome biogenesis protein 1 [Impatiens glandulifera]
MEVEVRTVASIENCFISLPTLLIQTLENTFSGPGSLPPFLALELRSPNTENLWYVAWSGSASSSSAIEISQRYAECISLKDRTRVQMRAVPNFPKATLVTVEPYTEDDWEVLELNAELAESDILSQVGIAQEAMRFPIWLHGRNVVTFTVVSTLPKSSAVQLVPGTELSVAPKIRKRSLGSSKDSSMQSLSEEHSMRKALLRVQDPGSRLMHSCEANGVEMDVELTSAIFIHPETAKKYKFESPQLVVIEPRLPWKGTINAVRSSSKDGLVADQHNSEIQTKKQSCTQVVVNLLILESVAKGHVMVSKSIRLYLQTSIHSWMYVKGCSFNMKKEFPLLSVSPFQFKMFGNSEAFDDNSYEAARNQANLTTKDPSLKMNLNADTFDRSIHERFVAALSSNSPSKDGEEIDILSKREVGLSCLLKTWYRSQLHVIASNASVQLNSLALGNTTLLHFVLKGDKLVNNGKVQPLSNVETSKPSIDVMYLLQTCDEPLQHENWDAYELDESNWGSNDVTSSDALERKLKMGESFILPTIKEKISDKNFKFHISSLSWMGTAASDVINRLSLLLSPEYQITYNLPLPGHILIYGPPGSGKTLLGTTAAKFVEEHAEILAHIVFVGCSKFSSEKSANIRQTLSGYVSEALNHAPSVIIFDDLDSIVSSSDGLEGSQPSASVVELTQLFLDIMDEYQEKRRNLCGIGPVAFIASAQSLTKIPQSLSSSGRFDFHVQLPPPTATERGALLKLEIQKRSLSCSDDILFDVASKCDGYDAYDLEILVDRAVHVASGRFLSPDVILDSDKFALLRDDFMHAMHEFLPVSMRDLNKTAPEGSRSGWLDVGGLTDIKNSIKEMIELPSKYPNVFAKSPLRLRSNVLLYGPPGCGKTHIVGAAAAACSLRFISIKGPELLNKYIGASEQAVRDIFAKAAAAAPCLLFFDEFDSIAPKRGHDNTGVTDRVVNQFLTELDGVEVLTGVFVFAATSRPDLLDAALLRPGRLDRLLFCDFPSRQERLDILTVLSQKLPMAGEVDLDSIANITDGLSGADLQALLSDAQLAAVHDALDKVEIDKPIEKPFISNNLLYSVASKARPSVSDSEKQRLYSIYNQFLDAKRSVSSQTRDAKGKRATLA